MQNVFKNTTEDDFLCCDSKHTLTALSQKLPQRLICIFIKKHFHLNITLVSKIELKAMMFQWCNMFLLI